MEDGERDETNSIQIHIYPKTIPIPIKPPIKKRKYLVLISFSLSQAATLFVRHLNGKPYNSFERDVIASVHHVAKLENDYEDDENDTNTTVDLENVNE